MDDSRAKLVGPAIAVGAVSLGLIVIGACGIGQQDVYVPPPPLQAGLVAAPSPVADEVSSTTSATVAIPPSPTWRIAPYVSPRKPFSLSSTETTSSEQPSASETSPEHPTADATTEPHSPTPTTESWTPEPTTESPPTTTEEQTPTTTRAPDITPPGRTVSPWTPPTAEDQAADSDYPTTRAHDHRPTTTRSPNTTTAPTARAGIRTAPPAPAQVTTTSRMYTHTTETTRSATATTYAR
ncbi:hypothetical protein ACFO5K_14610 [Nocardia halotolerans]|uniref:Uncharacterized protein n=1 Tax=Nocardia halotolerans TaxID=1755878 RepID=A0ABV8VH30_9NOCA